MLYNHRFFVHFSCYRCLGCFHFLVVENGIIWMWKKDIILIADFTWSEPCLYEPETSMFFFSQWQKKSFFFIYVFTFVIFWLCVDSLPSGFGVYLPNDWWHWPLSHTPFGALVFSFLGGGGWECLFNLLSLGCSCINELYELLINFVINPLSDHDWQIFSQSLGSHLKMNFRKCIASLAAHKNKYKVFTSFCLGGLNF